MAQSLDVMATSGGVRSSLHSKYCFFVEFPEAVGAAEG
jgi:hypothetical protein